MTTLRLGDIGPQVERLQDRLHQLGYSLARDGLFGRATDRALRAWQRQRNLVDDGIYGPRSQAAMAGTALPATLTAADIRAGAQRLGVDTATVHALVEVETRGYGFLPGTVEPVILFERHVMYRQLLERGYDVARIAERHPDIVNRRRGGYQGGSAEHRRLLRAQDIDVDAALSSASWGLFQVMGYHAERLGYGDVRAFARCMRKNEAEHLEAMACFVLADDDLHAALQARDWPTVAYRYNGPAYDDNDYDTRLAAAWRRHDRAAREQAAA